VVDFAKPIQTQNAQTEGVLLSSRLIDFLSQLSLEEATGGKIGERIPFGAVSCTSCHLTGSYVSLRVKARDNRLTVPGQGNLLPLHNWLAPFKEFASTARLAQYHKYRLLSRKNSLPTRAAERDESIGDQLVRKLADDES
jgi:hypothetical protein